jgi:putative spermidine/putrescine transport system permease protein
MKRKNNLWAWLWIVLGMLYFFTPLVSTFLFSLRGKKDVLSFVAYEHVFADPQFLKTFTFSLEMAVFTILAGLALIVPTAFWIHLKLPHLRPVIEFVTLLPFVIPPIVLVFGLIQLYSRPPLALVTSPALLVAGYVVLAFPYLYRAVDTGLQSMDVRSLSEAAQSLGASWFTILFQVILPNLRASLLSGIFLTFAIVIGELTLAVMLAWPAFGPYMALVGRDLAYEPAALSIISFSLTWGLIGLIQFLSRDVRGGSSGPLGGTH